MSPDLWSLYGLMYKSRKYEEAVRQLWNDGRISGEMHLGMGEEAIAAGIIPLLGEGDALALDHRGTPPLLMRGVDPVAMLREFMGRADGLCGGQGGHMHLFAPDELAASSGIVGTSGPAAAGFALAAQILRPGTVSVAFFGEGAANAGMLMESMNLAVVWNLPVVFVCKDNGLAITTPAAAAIAGNLPRRAEAFGMKALEVDGADVLAVSSVAQTALQHARSGNGPVFIRADCAHLEGHFLGDPLLDTYRRPIYSLRNRLWPLLKALFRRGGARWRERIASMRQIIRLASAAQNQTGPQRDPIARTRRTLADMDEKRLAELETTIRGEVQRLVITALQSEGIAS